MGLPLNWTTQQIKSEIGENHGNLKIDVFKV